MSKFSQLEYGEKVSDMIFLIAMLVATSAGAKSQMLDWLEIDKDFGSGCGCSIADTDGHVLIARNEYYYDGHDPAIIKISGKRYELKWVSSSEPPIIQNRGVRFSRIYEGNSIRLELSYKTIFLCDPKDEDCEVTRYAVDAALTVNGKTHQFTGLQGSCGC